MTNLLMTQSEYDSFLQRSLVSWSIGMMAIPTFMGELAKEREVVEQRITSQNEKGREIIETTTKVPYTSYLGSMVQFAKHELRQRKREEQQYFAILSVSIVLICILFMAAILGTYVLYVIGKRDATIIIICLLLASPILVWIARLSDQHEKKKTVEYHEKTVFMLESALVAIRDKTTA